MHIFAFSLVFGLFFFYEQLQTNDFLISIPLLESGLEMWLMVI